MIGVHILCARSFLINIPFKLFQYYDPFFVAVVVAAVADGDVRKTNENDIFDMYFCFQTLQYNYG